MNDKVKRLEMNMEIRFGSPVLIFIYSSALLLFGCAIGLYWSAAPSTAITIAILASVLAVVHDTMMALISLWAARVWIRANRK
jgi:hypothetical protein